MDSHDKTRHQLMSEIAELRAQLAEIQTSRSKYQQAEQELAKERNLLRVLIDNFPDLIYIKDREGHFIVSNLAVAHLMGTMPDDLVGKTDFDFYPRDIAVPYYEDEQRIIQFGESLINREEHSLDQKTGKSGWLLTTKVPYTDPTGDIVGIIGIGRDITALKEAQMALEQAKSEAEAASRTKSAFLANMSHELRTPLNAIIGYSELIEEECADLGQDNFIPDLKKIQTAAKHLLALVNDILDLSKIEAGKMDLYLEIINVPHMINDIAVTVTPLMEKNANRLEVTCPGDLGTMYADLTKVRQVIFNLLSNAAKFTKEGIVKLDVSRRSDSDQEWIVIHVADTGIGMTPDQVSRLFSDFSQADSSTTRKYGGTGLGLSISKHFCQMMGGAVAAQSDYGKGSIFTVQLPVTAPQAKPAPSTAALQPVEVSPGTDTVLVIDDDPAVCELMVRFLSKEGFRVEIASSGPEGIQRARELHPQVITLDVMMPGMDGWAVLSALKADPELSSIPVVMVTMVSDKNIGFALGASDYLTKPVNREQLVGVLRKYEAQRPEAQILVVEDDPDVRSILALVLRKEGWNVIEAESGQSALAQIAQVRPALILLDLMMPEMNGFEFIDELRKTESWRSIPIVVVTAMSLSPEARLRLTEQVQKVFQKSHDSRDTLLEEIRSIVTALAH
ncbi:MAG: response regulator [Chloroflexi bacterium]|nr:response regulator [Chloroflexota bacterium]